MSALSRSGDRARSGDPERLGARAGLLAVLCLAVPFWGCGSEETSQLGGEAAGAPSSAQQESEPDAEEGLSASQGSALMSVAPPSRAALVSPERILALERDPGATLAIPQTTAAAGPRNLELDGAPGASPAMGPENAPVKVFVFSDFQCPVCRRVVEPLKQLVRAHPAEVQVVFKHHALSTHRRAARAAVASLAAFRQGRFWEYHDLLFQNQQHLEEADLIWYAEALGLDLARFRTDMADPTATAQVVYESQMAQRLGARGTPGFFINGSPLLGWGSYQSFDAQVASALADARRVAESGVPPERVAAVATASAGESGRLIADLLWGSE